MATFDLVTSAPTLEEYQQRLIHLREVSASFDNFIDYVENTWLIPHKREFFLGLDRSSYALQKHNHQQVVRYSISLTYSVLLIFDL